MKILYITDYGTVGGATHSFIEMIMSLDKKGVKPIVITSGRDNLNYKLDKLGITNYSLGHRTVLEPVSAEGLRWYLRRIRKYLCFFLMDQIALYRTRKILKNHIISIIHTNSARNDLGCLISKETGIPHVMHIREFADADFNCISFRKNYISLFNNYTNKFISISEAVKDHWIGKGLNAGKISVVYNGINFKDITISSDESKNDDIIKIVIAGGVFPTKGQHLAVKALSFLPREWRKKVKLDIIGWYDECYVNKIKIEAEKDEVINQITFLGSRNDLHSLLGNYHIGLMCSKAEGFGRVTAEYMHARLGVIASDSGANTELIHDNENGLLFKNGDAYSLSLCILKYLENRQLLICHSNAAQIKARNNYTDENNATSILKLYNQILSNK